MELKEIQVEIIKCALDFKYFLGYVKIIETPSLETSGGVSEFKLWDHVIEAADAMLHNRLIVWLKSRQIGASWLVAAYCLWFALFKNGATIHLVSKGEAEAMLLLGKCHSILDNLPEWLFVKPDPDSRTEMGFTSISGDLKMTSTIKALPSTASASVSATVSILVYDEWDLHEYAVENYMNAKPCIDHGGQLIGIFTRNPQGDQSLAVDTFISARENRNGFKWLFHPYTVRPGRDEEWYARTKAELNPNTLNGMSPETYMMKAYPRTVEEALSVSGTIAAFEHDVLTSMLEDCKNPIPQEDIDNKIIKIYKPFLLGNYYISSADTAHGVGGDYSVAGIMNTKTGELVADIMRNDLSVEEFAEQYRRMLALYRDPLAFPEDNDWGHIVSMKLLELGYKNLGYQDEKKTKPGFKTDKLTRTNLFGALIPAINNRQMTIYNKEGVKQLFDLIRNPSKEGRIEARRGGHDDYAIMLGICWLKKNEVSQEEWSGKTISSLHFGSLGRRHER